MATQQDNEKIIWVAGNKQSVIIPMEKEVIPKVGDPYTEDFYPAEDDVVKVTLTGAYRPYIYTPEVDGHLLILTEPGTLPKGLYGVQITVVGNNGETRLRSFWDKQIVVTEKNNSVLKEWDEFKQQPVTARAAVFFFAKGDKGDPFTYDDFTEEQIADLKKPATDAAAEIADDYARLKEDYANNVKGDYADLKTDYATVKQDAQTATGAANNAAALAEQKAGIADTAAGNANNKATLAEQKAQYAKDQGDYAKQKAEEIEDAKGEYQSLDARLDAMDSDIADRFERITEEQFNEIFT